MLDNQLLFDFESSREVPSAQCALGLPASTRGDSLVFKTCSKCGETKPVDLFRIHRNTCKNCWSAYCANWMKKNSAKMKEYSREYHRANRDRYRNNNKIWRKNNPDRVRAISKRSYTKNKLILNGNSREYRRKNKARLAKYLIEWKNKNRKSVIEKSKKYYETNKDRIKCAYKKYRIENKEKVRIAAKRHYIKNKDLFLFHNKKRRARLVNSIGYKYTKQQHIIWRWEMWGNKCWICGNPAEATDHVIPLNPSYRDKPGPHLPANFRPICKSCNSSKLNKRPDLLKPVFENIKNKRMNNESN